MSDRPVISPVEFPMAADDHLLYSIPQKLACAGTFRQSQHVAPDVKSHRHSSDQMEPNPSVPLFAY